MSPEERARAIVEDPGLPPMPPWRRDWLARDIAAAIRAAVAEERDALALPIWQAWNELNAIHARDGAPQHIDWHQGRPIQTPGCAPEYFAKVLADCETALRRVTGDAPKPWPPKRIAAAIREEPT